MSFLRDLRNLQLFLQGDRGQAQFVEGRAPSSSPMFFPSFQSRPVHRPHPQREQPLPPRQSFRPEPLRRQNDQAINTGPPNRFAYRKPGNQAEFAEIIRNMYVGAQDAACDEPGLRRRGITHIINLATNVPNVFAKNGKIKYLRINVLDTVETNLRQYFKACFAFIDDALKSGGAVLVHCNAGISRSVTICIAYLMRRKGYSFEKAFKHVRDVRRQAYPNAGFVMQLRDFEKELQGWEKLRR